MNFFYGSNGVGKSTIANLIENDGCHPNCTVTWKNNLKLKTMVYNRQFVDANFSKVQEMQAFSRWDSKRSSWKRRSKMFRTQFEMPKAI
jgi:ATPase subunit of ABC transporter with duplicated ATPase domains